MRQTSRYLGAHPSLEALLPRHFIIRIFACIAVLKYTEARILHSRRVPVFLSRTGANARPKTSCKTEPLNSERPPTTFYKMDKFGNIQTNDSKPAIVISHGAWHVPAHYEPMAKPLREAGFKVFIPQHQSVGPTKDPGNALQNDAAALARIIEQNALLRRDVILFMHSYGGIAGSEAVGMLNEGMWD